VCENKIINYKNITIKNTKNIINSETGKRNFVKFSSEITILYSLIIYIEEKV